MLFTKAITAARSASVGARRAGGRLPSVSESVANAFTSPAESYRIRCRGFCVHVVTAFAPTIHRDGTGFTAAKRQTIFQTCGKVLFRKLCLLLLGLFTVRRAQTLAIRHDHGVHVDFARFAGNSEDDDWGLFWLGCTR